MSMCLNDQVLISPSTLVISSTPFVSHSSFHSWLLVLSSPLTCPNFREKKNHAVTEYHRFHNILWCKSLRAFRSKEVFQYKHNRSLHWKPSRCLHPYLSDIDSCFSEPYVLLGLKWNALTSRTNHPIPSSEVSLNQVCSNRGNQSRWRNSRMVTTSDRHVEARWFESSQEHSPFKPIGL